MKTKSQMAGKGNILGFLTIVCALYVFTSTAYAGVSIRYFINYGMYPYGAIDTTTTVHGTGLLANNGTGSTFMQLIYAGANNTIDGINPDNAAGGYVSGDDVVWQSITLESGVNDVDEWGFSSALSPPHTDLSWSTAGYVYIRIFEDDTPEPDDAYYTSALLVLDTSISGTEYLPQDFGLAGSSNAGFALNQKIPTTNIVRTIPAGKWDLLSVPVWMDTTNTFGEIDESAPIASEVYFYDSSISNFTWGIKTVFGWPAAAQNRVVLPGESFFLKSDIYSTGSVITITGTVPTTPITNQVHERWSALAYPFPVSVTWTDTSLSSNLPVGTLAYFWNRNKQAYDILLKGPPAKGGWGAEGAGMTIQPGDGFIIRQPLGSSAFEWVVEP